MKKNIYRLIATVMALGLMAGSPMASITSMACNHGDTPGGGFDGEYQHGDPEAAKTGNDGLGGDDGSSSGGGSSSRSSGGSSGGSSSGGSSSGSSSSGGSSSSYDGGSSYSEPSYDGGGSSDNGGSCAPAPAYNPNDVTVGTAGGQKFRVVMNSDHTSYQVFHCGISKVSFAVADSKGNAVAYDKVELVQGEDGLWYLNVAFAEDVDTKNFTVTPTAGDMTYLSDTLCVSGIKVNGTLVY